MPFSTLTAQPSMPSWRVLGPATAVLVFSLGWGLVSLYRSHSENYQRQAERELQAIGQLQTQNVADWWGQRLTDAQALSDDSLLGQAVAQWLQHPDNEALAAPVHERLRILQEHLRYHAVYLSDAEGRLRLTPHGRMAEDLPPPEQTALGQALAKGMPQVVDLRHDPRFAFPFFGVIAPLFKGNTPLGAIWLVMDPRASLYPLLTQWPTPSETAESSLVRRDPEVVRFLSPLRLAPETFPGEEMPLSLTQNVSVQAANGARGVYYGKDHRGQDVLAIANAVVGSHWVLVSKIDVNEVQTEMRRREVLVLGLPLSLGLLCMGGWFGLWQRRAWLRERRLKTALERNLRLLQEAQRVAAVGHYAYTPSTRELVLSEMAQEVLGIHDPAHTSLSVWEAALDPQDRADVMARHEQAMAQRTPLRLQYRLCRPSDGQWRWIEVRGEYGPDAYHPGPPRLLGTVQDITERKHTEEELARYRATLEAKVRLDLLTQVANRRALDEHVASEWQRAMRTGRPLALLMVDVDHFKAYNDRYGHLGGDACLRQVAQAMQGTVNRAGELVARYGGEEFAVLLPETSGLHALQVAQRLCAAVQALGIAHEDSSVARHVTVSVGVASMTPIFTPSAESTGNAGDDGDTVFHEHLDQARVLFEAADAALYRAKQQGRNQAVASTDTHTAPDTTDAAT